MTKTTDKNRENKGVIVSFRLSTHEFTTLGGLLSVHPRVGAGTPNKFARQLVLDAIRVLNPNPNRAVHN